MYCSGGGSCSGLWLIHTLKQKVKLLNIDIINFKWVNYKRSISQNYYIGIVLPENNLYGYDHFSGNNAHDHICESCENCCSMCFLSPDVPANRAVI